MPQTIIPFIRNGSLKVGIFTDNYIISYEKENAYLAQYRIVID